MVGVDYDYIQLHVQKWLHAARQTSMHARYVAQVHNERR